MAVSRTVLQTLSANLARAISGTAELRRKNNAPPRLLSELVRENQNLREQRELLERQLQAQMKLASKAVHQLRTPLVAVRGYARMLLDQEPGPINEAQREYLAVILENATRIASLLSKLSLSLAQQPSELESWDLVELWRESRLLLQPEALQKSIAFVEQLPDKPPMIQGDRDKLILVLHKLLSNTIKFARSGSRVEVQILPGRRQVLLRICDMTGGVLPELVEKAFGCEQESLEEMASRSSTKGAGGASLVHDIVRMHGGKISLTSGLGGRWSLTLALPVLPEGNRLEAHAKAKCPDSG